jgi:hypothetical protein
MQAAPTAGKKENFYKTLLVIAFPILLQNLMNSAVSACDTLMLGFVGQSELSVSSLAGNVQFIVNMFFFGICSGSSVLIAQYWGKKEMDPIRRIAYIGLRTAMILGIGYSLISFAFAPQILSVLTPDEAVVRAGTPYLRITAFSFFFFCVTQAVLCALRGVENAKFGMKLSFLTLLVNVTANYLLIFGKLGFPRSGGAGEQDRLSGSDRHPFNGFDQSIELLISGSDTGFQKIKVVFTLYCKAFGKHIVTRKVKINDVVRTLRPHSRVGLDELARQVMRFGKQKQTDLCHM